MPRDVILRRMREVINTAAAPSSPLFSQGFKAGRHIYVSGLVGIDAATGELAGPSIQERNASRSPTAGRYSRRRAQPWQTSSKLACC